MKQRQNRGFKPDPPETPPMPFVEELKPITHFHGCRDADGSCHLYKSNDEYDVLDGLTPTEAQPVQNSQVEILPDRSLAVYNHSPTGFEWGYGGSGPSQLALAIMLEVTDDDRKALSLYHDFKFDVVAGMPYEEWTIPLERIEQWITERPSEGLESEEDTLDDIPY